MFSNARAWMDMRPLPATLRCFREIRSLNILLERDLMLLCSNIRRVSENKLSKCVPEPSEVQDKLLNPKSLKRQVVEQFPE